jgi:hypothetical protein
MFEAIAGVEIELRGDLFLMICVWGDRGLLRLCLGRSLLQNNQA